MTLASWLALQLLQCAVVTSLSTDKTELGDAEVSEDCLSSPESPRDWRSVKDRIQGLQESGATVEAMKTKRPPKKPTGDDFLIQQMPVATKDLVPVPERLIQEMPEPVATKDLVPARSPQPVDGSHLHGFDGYMAAHEARRGDRRLTPVEGQEAAPSKPSWARRPGPGAAGTVGEGAADDIGTAFLAGLRGQPFADGALAKGQSQMCKKLGPEVTSALWEKALDAFMAGQQWAEDLAGTGADVWTETVVKQDGLGFKVHPNPKFTAMQVWEMDETPPVYADGSPGRIEDGDYIVRVWNPLAGPCGTGEGLGGRAGWFGDLSREELEAAEERFNSATDRGEGDWRAPGGVTGFEGDLQGATATKLSSYERMGLVTSSAQRGQHVVLTVFRKYIRTPGTYDDDDLST